MGFKFSHLYARPDVNPVTLKARSIPLLNPVDIYGRVFFFSWFGFMIAFWAWYTFPPLLTHTIKNDLGLSPTEVANSNIVSLCVTLVVRLIAGPLCDKFGPRIVFGGLLLIGSIPLGLAPLVRNAQGLYVSRFFIGILGGSFVPCQVWSTGFFDKNVVGTANALAGGFGTAGGGITYFIMPAVYDALAAAGYTPGRAWRLTFLVPLSMVITTGTALLLLCPDTPTGRWKDRHLHGQRARPLDPEVHSPADIESEIGAGTDFEKANSIVDVPGRITDRLDPSDTFPKPPTVAVAVTIPTAGAESSEKKNDQPVATAPTTYPSAPSKAPLPTRPAATAAATTAETVQPPTARELVRVALSPQAAFHALTYMCSFGTELAIDGVLAAHYTKQFPRLSQTEAACWAAAFGFLNVVSRPLGGVVSDLLYRRFSSPPPPPPPPSSSPLAGGGEQSSEGGHEQRALWWKKGWVTVCGISAGTLLVLVGALNPGRESAMFGLFTVLALFLEAGNGANFSLVPHVHPHANGVLSGLTGAAGNLGGVLFAVVFRCMDGGVNYAKGLWVIGTVNLAVNLAVCWIPPLPKGQVGGR